MEVWKFGALASSLTSASSLPSFLHSSARLSTQILRDPGSAVVDLWRPHFKARFPVVATSPNRSFHKNSRTSIIHSSLHPIRRMDAPLDMDGTSPRSRKLSTSIPIRLQTLFGRSRSPFPLVLSKPLHCRRRCHGGRICSLAIRYIMGATLQGDWTGCHTGNRKMGRIGCTGQCCPLCQFLFFLYSILSSHSVHAS